MKKILGVVLLLCACNRDSAERAAPEASTTEAVTTASTSTSVATSTTPAETTGTAAPEASTAPVETGRQLAFVDDGSGDPSFAADRDRLLAAVRAKDAKKVAALADPKIRTSFGGAGGRAELEKMLARPGMFEELEQILTLGGSFQGEGNDRSFWAPYVYSDYPDAQDAFTTVAVIADRAPLHEKADASSPVMATLSRNIVERLSEEGTWTKVTTPGRKSGFVETRLVRSPIDYRAGFIKSAEGWRMNALVAGD